VSLHDTFLDFQLWDARRRLPCRSRGEAVPPCSFTGPGNTDFYSAPKFVAGVRIPACVRMGRLGGTLFSAAVETRSGTSLASWRPLRILSNFRERPARVTRWSEAAVAIR
jgi:hypothetical protein